MTAEHGHGPRSEQLYIYDRVCTKASKQRQMQEQFGAGTGRPSSPNEKERAERRQTGTAQSRRQADGGGRSGQHRPGQPPRNRRGTSRPGNAYGNPPRRQSVPRSGEYRQSAAYRSSVRGGEAVRERPVKLILDRIVNFFETIEERGRNDERIAKQRAIATKKFSEYRHTFFTALLLVLITAAFVFLVYKVFFVITDVTVEGSDRYTAEEIVTAAGFGVGDNLYSFKASDAEGDITFRCPYIKTAELNRTVPKYVSVAVTDDSAMYYCRIWGDVVKLSAGLRVLEVTTAEEAKAQGLTELILPPIRYSVAGRVLEFENPANERLIREVLAQCEQSALAAREWVDRVDFTDLHRISMHVDGKYLLECGDEEDFDLKLRMVYKTITDTRFDRGTPARIDLSTVGEASVRFDMRLTFE